MGRVCNTFTLTVIAACLCASCYDADPRSIRGAIDAAARAIEADDGTALFRVIDQRSRHAMDAIVAQRREAAQLIRAHYPPEEQARALSALGDAATVESAAQLFAERCDRSCRRAIGQKLGAPASQTRDGVEVVVTTTQGQTLRLHRGTDTWYGLVWETEALDRERSRVAQELSQIRENADVYRRRRALSP